MLNTLDYAQQTFVRALLSLVKPGKSNVVSRLQKAPHYMCSLCEHIQALERGGSTVLTGALYILPFLSILMTIFQVGLG